MLPRLLALFWLFLVPVLCTDPAIDKLFVIKKTDIAESRALTIAGLQAIKHTKDSSAKESNVAKRYLYTYFRADNTESITFVENRTFALLAIEDIEEYRPDLWEQDKKGSDDLEEYVFNENYGSKTYCTESNQNLVPSTITLCPSAFINSQATANLGSKAPKVRMLIDNVLPQSRTFYHELFYLVLGSEDTPDIELPDCCESLTRIRLKNSPNTKPLSYDEDYQHLIRRNPESYLWFSVGYWLFLQTQWSESSN
ncbi:uncharacterized protein N7473_011009 [Penicillium subrubescens]|uniref:uncharacterized protein n=1 Tax=Penicillium subrubescens TaxID=1316194 RepID=UPI002545AE5C|nr:uncharacterized protein N7473_011009 [Penicillium subrubescens]KAJ5884123.1 hypothetical protein N7473_011009 [Penicillium subrubescens]